MTKIKGPIYVMILLGLVACGQAPQEQASSGFQNISQGPDALPISAASCQVSADFNGDSIVDILDASEFIAAGLYGTGLPASREQGDANCDGIVDDLDVQILNASYGE